MQMKWFDKKKLRSNEWNYKTSNFKKIKSEEKKIFRMKSQIFDLN